MSKPYYDPALTMDVPTGISLTLATNLTDNEKLILGFHSMGMMASMMPDGSMIINLSNISGGELDDVQVIDCEFISPEFPDV